MARLRGEASNWGAFVDAVSDRYSELILMAGLVVLLHRSWRDTGCYAGICRSSRLSAGLLH